MKYYTEEHEWVEISGDDAIVGISEYAVDELGEVTSIEFPDEGDDFIVGDRLGCIKGTNSSCELCAPISGSVSMINEALSDDPGLMNESPERKGWICKLTDFDSSELDDMMDEETYLRYLRTL